MEIVECSLEYWEFIRALRNDPRVQDGFIEHTFITEEMQNTYMKEYSNCYRVALLNDQPAGYVGVIENDIRICTHPDFQGKGIGKFMLNKCHEIWPNATAKIKLTNTASLRLFESCGFMKKYYILSREEK